MKKGYEYFPVVISAPSGGGKSTVKNFLLKKDSRFAFSITCTTRPRRPGEKNGKDYYFVTERRFRELLKKGELIEWARVHGHLYGTPRKSVLTILRRGLIPLMTIDVKGARSVKRIFSGAVSIFMLPPDPFTMLDRLKKRGESVRNLSIRFETARKEMKEASSFDYVVVNDDLKKAVEDIIAIIRTEIMRACRRKEFLSEFASQLGAVRITEEK